MEVIMAIEMARVKIFFFFPLKLHVIEIYLLDSTSNGVYIQYISSVIFSGFKILLHNHMRVDIPTVPKVVSHLHGQFTIPVCPFSATYTLRKLWPVVQQEKTGRASHSV